MGYCDINPVWRHQFLYRRDQVGGRKQIFMSHSTSMFNDSFYWEICSHKETEFFHISSVQFFPDKCATDLTASVHFFWQDFRMKSIFLSELFEHGRSSFPLIAKTEILSNCHIGNLQISYQYFFYKILCFHVPYFLCERTFQQYIHSHFFQYTTSLFLCEDCSWGSSKRKYNRLCTFLFLLNNFLNQFLMSAVYAVKLPKCYRAVWNSGKIILNP